MLRFTLNRVLAAIPVLLGLSVVVFLILHLLPGDPAQAILFGRNATAADVVEFREALGLTDPLPVQYVRYLGDLVQADLGTSFLYEQPVREKIFGLLPHTLVLTLSALTFALMLGIPSGILAATYVNRPLDKIVTGIAVLGVTFPAFWLALLLTRLFALQWGILPSLGIAAQDSTLFESTKAMVLPAVSLGWPLSSILARLLRDSLIDVYESPYVLAARARGYGTPRILRKHALRNAFGPVVSMLGLQFGGLMAGAVAIEVIFGRPGVGAYLVESMRAKDIPAIQGVILTVAVIYLVVNLVVDLGRAVLEPRVRAELQAG